MSALVVNMNRGPKAPAIGTRVHHTTFGFGNVVRAPKAEHELPVEFDEHGLKHLVWTFAHVKMRVVKPGEEGYDA